MTGLKSVIILKRICPMAKLQERKIFDLFINMFSSAVASELVKFTLTGYL